MVCIMKQFYNIFLLQAATHHPHPTHDTAHTHDPAHTHLPHHTHSHEHNEHGASTFYFDAKTVFKYTYNCQFFKQIFVKSTEFLFFNKTMNTKFKSVSQFNGTVHCVSCSLCCKLVKLILCT